MRHEASRPAWSWPLCLACGLNPAFDSLPAADASPIGGTVILRGGSTETGAPYLMLDLQ